VQRAVVLLNEKNVAYDITYIDLKNKPDWFLRLSPLGKVPALKVGGTVLFESAVICEYLDEISPPSLHPSDPLAKALNRAWIEFSSELFMSLHRLYMAEDGEKLEEGKKGTREKLQRLEDRLGEGPFFNGPQFSLIDAAIAPAFWRISLLDEIRPLGLCAELPKVKRWSDALLARDSIRTSVVPEFPLLLREYLAAAGSYLARGR
jgi:glutathione S-transferase